jgi:hypothetical protein
MGELRITLSNGTTLGFVQATTLANLRTEHGVDKTHWHLNECGCCVTLHAPPGAYVIGPDGDAEFFPGAHCGCGGHVTGQTDV